MDRWQRLLADDRKRRSRSETPIEALYDGTTGLPE
jgi:hypothetical protein